MHYPKWTERSQFPSRLVHKWSTTKYDVQVAFVIMKKICFLHLNKIVELFAKIFVENSDPFCCLPNQRKWVWSHRISLWLPTCYCKSNSLRDSDGSVSVCRVAWQKLANISPERCRCSWRRNIYPERVDCFYVRCLVHLVVGLVWTEFVNCFEQRVKNSLTDFYLWCDILNAADGLQIHIVQCTKVRSHIMILSIQHQLDWTIGWHAFRMINRFHHRTVQSKKPRKCFMTIYTSIRLNAPISITNSVSNSVDLK